MQGAFWEEPIQRQQAIVNVAQVPQRSPFRYPGGKTWLVPTVRRWLASLRTRPKHFVEPFVGGGIVSLTVSFEDLADHVTIVELDSDVAALWKTILSDDNEWLADRVIEFEMTVETVSTELAKRPLNIREHAFQTLLRNRTNHGGILAPGSGVLKHGENGKGIKSRWYAETLRKRIRNIARFRHKITFIQGDGLDVINTLSLDEKVAFFVDPPYTAGKNGKRAGTRLYTHNELDHEALFLLCSGAMGNVLMTYDNAIEVSDMALRHRFQTRTVGMKNTHHANMRELLIGRDLSWL